MPRVRMLTSYADLRNSWEAGEEADVNPKTAQSWIEAGIAESIAEERVNTPERGAARSEIRRPNPR